MFLIDTATKTAIEMLHDDDIHSNPHVRHGLQGIIPGHCNLVSIRTNGKKVSMSVAQARNELKGQVKGQRKAHLSCSPTHLLPLASSAM
jgi:hypothetical protein